MTITNLFLDEHSLHLDKIQYIKVACIYITLAIGN